MTPKATKLSAAALVAILTGATLTPNAFAAERSRTWIGLGGGEASRAVDRKRGAVEVERSVLGPYGRGVEVQRSTGWGQGVLSSSTRRTFASGATLERGGSIVRGDGAVTATGTRTGISGQSESGWTTVYRSEDGFGRSRGLSTSGGRSLSASTDVSVGDDSLTVQRAWSTASGAERSRTRTWTRH